MTQHGCSVPTTKPNYPKQTAHTSANTHTRCRARLHCARAPSRGQNIGTREVSLLRLFFILLCDLCGAKIWVPGRFRCSDYFSYYFVIYAPRMDLPSCIHSSRSSGSHDTFILNSINKTIAKQASRSVRSTAVLDVLNSYQARTAVQLYVAAGAPDLRSSVSFCIKPVMTLFAYFALWVQTYTDS